MLSRLILCCCASILLAWSFSAHSGELTNNVSLHQLKFEGSNKNRQQNFSGAGFDGENVLLVDDGGIQLPSIIYFWSGKPDDTAWIVPFPLPHQIIDLEAATYNNGYFYMSTSLSDNEPNFTSSRWVSRFTYDRSCNCVTEFKSKQFQHKIFDALAKIDTFDGAWISRVIASNTKQGGLNLEGLASHHARKDTLLMGFRSPLFSEHFGNPDFDPTLSLETGDAIIAEVKNIMDSASTIQFHKLDLKGSGVRSIEWVEALNAYLILSGTAHVGSHYGLWQWNPSTKVLEEHIVPELQQLCRPETIFAAKQGNKTKLTILSELSGKICKDHTVDMIQIEIQ